MGVSARAGGENDAAVAHALRLALGHSDEHDVSPPKLSWDAVYDVAFRERLAPLAWLRSGAIIRRDAPPAVRDRWRSYVVALHAHGARQLALMADTIAAMRGGGVVPVVLKGLPLAARLYGEYWVRATGDTDLYIPLECRDAARRVLLEGGWLAFAGTAPGEEAFVRDEREGRFYVEVHSTAADERLEHLPLCAPCGEPARVEGYSFDVHSGPLLPAQLAAHLAKHRLAPLLWFVDFHTLWQSLSASQREAALRAATTVRLSGYLRWAVARSDAVVPASRGEPAALRALGCHGNARRDHHPLIRDIALAQSRGDALRVLGAWVLPRPLRSDWRAIARRYRIRAGKGLRYYLSPASVGERHGDGRRS